MLEEFNFPLVETQKDMEFVSKAYEKHARKLKNIMEAITVKQRLKGKFTVEQLDEYTDYIIKTQEIQQSKIVATQYIHFLEQLKVPFEQKKNQLKDKISDILLMNIIRPYQKEMVQSIRTRLINYKAELDSRDEQNFRIIENSKEIPLFMSEQSHIMEPKVQQVLLGIVRRDVELSKVFECVNIEYESTLLGRVFNKLYQVTRSIIVLGPKFTLGEVELILKHVQHLFIKNCNYLKTIIDSPTTCSYCIQQLYKCLVAKNVLGILAKGNLPPEESYFLVQRMLKLQTDIKAKTNTDHDISDRQSLLNVIYKQNKKLFQQLLSFEEREFTEKIFENPQVANYNKILDLQNGFEVFIVLLKSYYMKYFGMSNCEYKQAVDKRFSKIVSRMIKYLNLNISALMKDNQELQQAFDILEYQKTVENQIENNQLMSQIKKHDKDAKQEMDLFKSNFNKKLGILSEKEYQYQKSADRIFSESQWIGKLLKTKSNTVVQKELFLKRMRLLFFKFLKDYKFKKIYLNKFLDIFSPILNQIFKNKCIDLIEVIQSGNTAQKYKELTFLTQQERTDVSKLKVVE